MNTFFKRKFTKSKSTPKSKLDKVFSEYIRLRDCNSGLLPRIGFCISCGVAVIYETCDAGHFISRNKTATRWNEQNVNAQCRKCNRFESGRQFEQSKGIDKKYGKGTAERLLIISKALKSKLTHADIEELVKYYKAKIKELKK
jgi:5-methylcytosine-specific restriction endonuclease McrA